MSKCNNKTYESDHDDRKGVNHVELDFHIHLPKLKNNCETVSKLYICVDIQANLLIFYPRF